MSYPTLDGKQIVMTSCYPAGVQAVFAGSGDGAAVPAQNLSGRGLGPAFTVSLASANAQTVTWSWQDYVYMAGGSVTWDNAIIGDFCSMGVTCPATPFTANAAGTGNAMMDPAGTGKILPGNGAGGIDINLNTAVPVPNLTATGAWMWGATAGSYVAPPTGKGILFPSANIGFDPQVTWTYDVYPATISLGTFVNHYQLCGTRSHDLSPDDIKPQQILPHWQSWATISAAAGVRTNNLNVTWSITLARMVTT